MTKLPTPAQLAELIGEIRTALDRLEQGVLIVEHDDEGEPQTRRGGLNAIQLVDRVKDGSRDGYRSSTRGGRGQVNGVSDPVFDVVAAGPAGDRVWRAANTVVRGLTGARGDLRMAVSALATAEPPADTGSVQTDELWCVVHLRHGMTEPRDPKRPLTGRCSWCYGFALAEGIDPPRGILELRAQGVRITEKVLEQFCGTRRERRRRRQRKDKAG